MLNNDKMSHKSWQPVSTLSKKLELRSVTKPSHLVIPQSSVGYVKDGASGQAIVHGATDANVQPRITEETSGSNPSSTAKSPEITDGRNETVGTPAALPKSGSNVENEK